MISLDATHLTIVRRILAAHMPEAEVRAFGSRINGKPSKYSDLDLVLVASERIPNERIEALKDAFSESDLPIQMDVLDWNAISPAFREVIEKNYEVIQKSNKKRLGMGPAPWSAFFGRAGGAP